MFSKLVRLTKDAELATTPSGKQVLKISCCYDVGWGDSKRTVWVDASMWGDRGAKIAQYLLKGSQTVIHADDVECEAYQGKNGLSTKLKMTVINVELVAKTNAESQAAQKNDLPPATPGVPQGGFGMEEDIPFMRLDSTFAT